jgi:hypothetical protein
MTLFRALGASVIVAALGAAACAAPKPPGRLLRAGVAVGKTYLHVREVTVGTGPYPQKNRAYYTRDDKEVIPARFRDVTFMNDKVGFAADGGSTYLVRFDRTGKTPATFEPLPYRTVKPFVMGRTGQAAEAERRVWFGVVDDKPHIVQRVPVIDITILDDQGGPTTTIHDVLSDFGGRRQDLPAQQGKSLQFRVMPATGDVLHVVTDLDGKQTEPVMPNLRRFWGLDPRIISGFEVLALPVGDGRFAPFAADGHLRRLVEPGLIGYRPDKSRGDIIGFWWKDYEVDGERLTGWANPDLSEESGPLWGADSIELVSAKGLVAQRRDGTWEFYPGPDSLLETGERTPKNRADEFPWSKVTPQTFEAHDAALAAAEVPVERERQLQRARAQKAAERRVAELERRKKFLDAVGRGSEREACQQVAGADTQQQYREIDVVVARLHGSNASAICGVSLETLVGVLRDPKSLSIVRALRQIERQRNAEAAARDRARRAAEAKELARQQELAREQAEARQSALSRSGTWAPRASSSSSSFDVEASRAYTRALNDWTYGKSSWRPYKQ